MNLVVEAKLTRICTVHKGHIFKTNSERNIRCFDIVGCHCQVDNAKTKLQIYLTMTSDNVETSYISFVISRGNICVENVPSSQASLIRYIKSNWSKLKCNMSSIVGLK